MKMTLTTWIDAPTDRVWALFIDLANHAGRITGITKVEMLTPGPVAVGTRFKETRTMFGRDATEEFTVTALEPGRLYTMTANSCGVAYTATHTFAAENGGTRVTLDLSGKATSFFAWLMKPLGWLMQGAMKSAIQKDLDDLKRAVEATNQAA